ncbi:NAD-glutamate dehydrogenase [Nitrogeniibacter mangrovi]|uniref:NAD-glutamate dehydrogenase n=1 Tax=Nitrogeniibacter mangrovi TaxID=2016596 RepID=A0A6C1B0E3_9RHOO|nr:NAD-glutamate dehydrogenase [Nitrogeniibacter mangrovi]QID17062.1 NAD-glutamate dehydrogenase [Nitrogeniibacter mangrovi]
MNTGEAAKADLVDTVVTQLRQRLPAEQAALAETFVRQYFAQVDPDDLANHAAADLYGAALSHLNFARHIERGSAKLRVYNPQLDEHGWQSTHTVIELVQEDMPFLVDSLIMEINRQGLAQHLIIHPVMKVARDAGGELQSIAGTQRDDAGRLESIIHAEVDRRTSAADLEALEAGLRKVLADVAVAVEDWRKMQHRVIEAITEIEEQPPQGVASTEEERAFLQWVANDHFTFLGHREYVLTEEDGETQLRAVPDSGLGILREMGAERSSGFSALPQEIREQAREPVVLVLTKSNSRSTVHRAAYLDYIGIKRFDAQGRVTGERRFLGLYTSVAYHAGPASIPILRRKVSHVLARGGFLPNSHGAKTLATILQQYPRDELFQIDDDELYEIAMGILRLGERLRTRLFVRHDPYGRFFACLIYTPRENYNTEMRQRFQAILMKAFDGHGSDFEVQLSDSVLARILIIVRTPPGTMPDYDVHELEARLVRAARRWEDGLHAALVERCGEERGNALFTRYRSAFPAGYREEHDARNAAQDVELIDTLADDGLGLSLYVPLEAAAGQLRFKIVCRGTAVPLSDSLPMLESLGVRVIEERPYEVLPEADERAWIHDFGLHLDTMETQPLERLRDVFQEAFRRLWTGQSEIDNFNRLVTGALLGWREVALLRAYARYMKQAGSAFSQTYLGQTLSAYPDLVRQLIALFRQRFDPALAGDSDARAQQLVERIEAALDAVANLDEDRILRQFLALVEASLRTNYFQRDDAGEPKSWIAFKLDPACVPGLPEPRPAYEIFVYSPRMEGVHLRGGSVARGGLRWSDRMEDYRTEVLGLVKAQMVKNTVIVPVGSKGGFVVKQPPAGGERDALQAEGLACYRTFLRGMLDLTDNRVGGQVVPPPDVVRRDGDDPYLVVAADKGTATFSDHANAVAHEYGFWLGDAFASGGSAGYDHKKMGITARGAWESVKRHFRELGHDTQSEDFTVVGIGDMSGDVFGNGMLLSPHIRLVAAFDHRHIFIDPSPDAARSFEERRRLFALPRSSWADYDSTLISAGGGVWPRSAKSISLPPAARKVLGIERESLTPLELIRAILLAPVDLLYNGGIGTYVKASAENNVEVGDRANDGIRVDAADLRVKVVGEGGNLGVTQRGRIEFALGGGRIYTDAIDNSGGVACSDHEVNIKILLDAVVTAGDMTPKQRDALLEEMTDEVAALVLRDNYFQGQVISVSCSRAAELLDKQARYLRHLGNSGRLNRKLEFLPFDEELAERKARNQGLAAPELAVLLAYSKMELYEAVLDADVPEDPYIATALTRYFPKPLRERFADPILAHPLRREIIATHVINSMINRVGASFVFRVQEESGAAPADIVRAYMATREVFGLVDFWQQIEALDNVVADATQTGMIIAAQQLIMHGTLWFLHRRSHLQDLDVTLRRFGPGVGELTRNLPHLLAPAYLEDLEHEAERLTGLNVPESLARRAAGMDALHSALDIVEVADRVERDTETVAQIYSAIDARLNLHWLWRQIAALPADSHWHGMARKAMLDDVASRMRELTAGVFRGGRPEDDAAALLAQWAETQAYQLGRWEQVRGELQNAGSLDMAMVSVALRELRVLVPATATEP